MGRTLDPRAREGTELTSVLACSHPPHTTPFILPALSLTHFSFPETSYKIHVHKLEGRGGSGRKAVSLSILKTKDTGFDYKKHY